MSKGTIVEIGNFRLQKISKIAGVGTTGKLGFVNSPISEGLAIEIKTGTGRRKSYIVVAFVKYNIKELNCELQCVGMRILDLNLEETAVFKRLVNAASEIINAANMVIADVEIEEI